MRFKEFLAEATHKRSLEIEEAEKLLEEHCKDAMKLFHRPIWRGTRRSGEDAYLIHGEDDNAEGRRSANTSNYYTILMDKFLPYFGYPKRSKSIICANDENKDYARSFGTVYAVFPYDGVSIGVCEDHDLWETAPFKIGKNPEKRSITAWNQFFGRYILSSASWNDFKETLAEHMEDNEHLAEWFGPPEKIESIFKAAYSPENLNLELTNSDNVDKIRGARELWIGGKCVLIRKDIWEEMLEAKGLAP